MGANWSALKTFFPGVFGNSGRVTYIWFDLYNMYAMGTPFARSVRSHSPSWRFTIVAITTVGGLFQTMTTFLLQTSDFRSHLADILSRVYYKDHSFIIERNGKPTAALVSIEDYQLVKQHREEAEARLVAKRQENVTTRIEPEPRPDDAYTTEGKAVAGV